MNEVFFVALPHLNLSCSYLVLLVSLYKLIIYSLKTIFLMKKSLWYLFYVQKSYGAIFLLTSLF
jgi:hypothetical protein